MIVPGCKPATASKLGRESGTPPPAAAPTPHPCRARCHQPGHVGRGLGACAGVEEEGAGAAGEDVLDRARHLVAGGPDHFAEPVGEARVERLRPLRTLFREARECDRVRAVDRPIHRGLHLGGPAVEAQLCRAGRELRQSRQDGGLGHRVLAHAAVGRPLAAGDRHQARRGDEEGVIAGEGGGLHALGRPPGGTHQGAQSGETGEHVRGRRVAGQIARDVGEDPWRAGAGAGG